MNGPDIDIDQFKLPFEVSLVKRTENAEPGTVDQKIDPFPANLPVQIIALILAGKIHPHHAHMRLQCPRELFHAGNTPGCKDQVGPAAAELAGKVPADTGACARNQRLHSVSSPESVFT
jgi:hypothetical protein